MENTNSPAPTHGLRRAVPASWWLPGLLLALVLAMVLICFSPSLSAGWLNWDDDRCFLENPYYRGLGLSNLAWMWSTGWMGHYQPLTWMSLGLDYMLWGMDPRGYHLGNLVLHMAGAALLFLLLYKALPMVPGGSTGVEGRRQAGSGTSPGLALAAAGGGLFYAIHPLRVESVAWITERRDLLAMVFYLLTLLAWLFHVERGKGMGCRWYLAALAFHLASLASKAHAITLPMVLLVLDVWPFCRWKAGNRLALIKEKVPFMLAAALAAYLAIWAQSGAQAMMGSGEQGFWNRLSIVIHGLAYYPVKTIFPTGLTPLHGLGDMDGLSLALHAGLLLGISTLLLLLRRRFPAGLTAWVIYGIVLSPVSGIAQSGPQLVAERYATFSCLPFAFLFGGLLLLSWPRALPGSAMPGRFPARSALLLLTCWLSVLGLLTFRQTRCWHDSVSLWSCAARVDPDDPVVQHQLGNALLEADRPQLAVLALEKAVSASPQPDQTLLSLGVARARLGQYESAIGTWSGISSQSGQYASARLNIGRALLLLGRVDSGVIALLDAVEADPSNTQVYPLLVENLEKLGQGDLARHYRERWEELEVTYSGPQAPRRR